MLTHDLQGLIAQAVRQAIAAGDLPSSAPAELPPFEVELPRDPRHGDFAANVALVLARTLGRSPRDVGAAILRHLPVPSGIVSKAELAGPGFLNLSLAPAFLHRWIRRVHADDRGFGRTDIGGGRRVLVEYVSANPTGPLTVGSGRNGAVGETVARLLEALGYRVSREYYVNDYGNQVELLARSVEARYLEALGRPAAFPEDGYRGAYVAEIGRQIAAAQGAAVADLDPVTRVARIQEIALAAMLSDIRTTLEVFGVTFDTWFSERTLHDSGAVEQVLDELRRRGVVYEQDGALWFRATQFGDDKDRVMIRADGRPTYFAADIPYHLDKYARGFEHLIDVFGIDHIGDVARVRGGLEALGKDPSSLEVLLYQHVRLRNEGEVVRMSKRSGEFITLRDLLDAVGRDAARFFFTMTSPSAPMDFDFALAQRTSADNPVYYVHYAHARICSILREAERVGIGLPRAEETDLHLLTAPEEWVLAKRVVMLPEVVYAAGTRREPQRLCAYARELAEAFHAFYTQCRVLTEDPRLSAARLVLVDAARRGLRNTLDLIGVVPVERM
ncbi:MAG TPA: arginine--tRNA ligase [bacterium]|nr:arginine--tRNA ligase [bacterium]